VGAALVLVLAAWALWPVTVLELRAGPEGRLVKAIPVATGDRIVYGFTHSVQKSRVVEVLEVAPGNHLVVRETIYEDTGAGLPSDLPDGQFSMGADGKFHITGMSRDIPVWRVRVAFTAQQTLEVGAESFRLDSLAPPTTVLTVGAVTRPRFGPS
jgi:hypothetical protein